MPRQGGTRRLSQTTRHDDTYLRRSDDFGQIAENDPDNDD